MSGILQEEKKIKNNREKVLHNQKVVVFLTYQSHEKTFDMAWYNTFIKWEKLPEFATNLGMTIISPAGGSAFEAEIRNPNRTSQVLANIEAWNPYDEKVVEISIYDRECATPQDVKNKYI